MFSLLTNQMPDLNDRVSDMFEEYKKNTLANAKVTPEIDNEEN